MPRAPCEVFDRFLSKILPGVAPIDMRDKSERVREYVQYMLNRTSQIFVWRNLPETIPARMLELYLQTNGNVCIYNHNGALYAFVGGLGGEPNAYYMPTIYTIANPALQLSVNASIDDDCIVIPSDTMYTGLLPLIRKYATLLVETELSLYVNLINSRVPAVIGADNSGTAESANMMLADVERGKLGVVATNALFDGMQSLPYSATASHTLTDLLEVEQYLKASLYNDIGLQSNYNMKRERLTDDETALNETALLPLIDDMLLYRKKGADAVNAKWGTSVTVELSSAWRITQDSARAESDDTSKEGETDEQPENSD